ncbi:hypothetical protein Q4S45_19205 [Massilia sp. R2A-15]|uniref:hypothetical protein n=1 Tax=Massilia sp. R2A-15 TaxID=3064278 RepID=UPI002733AB17|nr:hypothetical protein [Massilia sp. R2A-15]WLI88812.1 hypothetical protein Q4S45_19205 [Massilia sp. R2A-15]
MSSIQIQDLSHRSVLDNAAMSSVRGGSGIVPDVNVNVSLNQQFLQFQQVGVNVLNNNAVIGANFGGADMNAAADTWQASHGGAPA